MEEDNRKEPEQEEGMDDEASIAWLERFKDRWHREITIILFIVLIILVMFMAYAVGGLKVCSDLDGVLDSGFKCHPNYEPPKSFFDNVGQPFIIPSQEEILNISPELR